MLLESEGDPTTLTTYFAIDGLPEHKVQHALLHAFGHVLGMHHAHQHPQYLEVMKEFLDEAKCYKKWKNQRPKGKIAIEAFLRQNLWPSQIVDGYDYDEKSIMHYPYVYSIC